MPHDVFISYATQDKTTADAVRDVLEQDGYRCWIAPRDILPGESWGGAIMAAINQSRAMVLVFSGHANKSAFVQREVERAVSRRIPVIPMRIEDITPSDSLELFISSQHWLDAFTPPLERHLGTLVAAVGRVLERAGAHAPEPDPVVPPIVIGAFPYPPGVPGAAPDVEETTVPPQMVAIDDLLGIHPEPGKPRPFVADAGIFAANPIPQTTDRDLVTEPSRTVEATADPPAMAEKPVTDNTNPKARPRWRFAGYVVVGTGLIVLAISNLPGNSSRTPVAPEPIVAAPNGPSADRRARPAHSPSSPAVDVDAAYNAGIAAYNAKDYAAALRQFRIAADGGHASAQSFLGWLYQNAQGVAQDYAEAMRWYRKAADQGVAFAQWNVGMLYVNGWGVPSDKSQARPWMRKAADGGYDLAKKWLTDNPA